MPTGVQPSCHILEGWWLVGWLLEWGRQVVHVIALVVS